MGQSEVVGHPGGVGQVPDVGHSASPDDSDDAAIEEAERLLRVEAGRMDAEAVHQSIPHDVMIAGLLAASRMRPRLVIESPHISTSSWASGVAELQVMAPLVGFSFSQWRHVQIGCAALLASHGPEMARLGWATEEAFGVHPEVGGNAVHCYGLGLLVGDGRVSEMTDTVACINLRSGAQQRFVRRPKPWAVPIWTAICRA